MPSVCTARRKRQGASLCTRTRIPRSSSGSSRASGFIDRSAGGLLDRSSPRHRAHRAARSPHGVQPVDHRPRSLCIDRLGHPHRRRDPARRRLTARPSHPDDGRIAPILCDGHRHLRGDRDTEGRSAPGRSNSQREDRRDDATFSGLGQSLRDGIRMIAEGLVTLDRKVESFRRPPDIQ